MNQVCRIFSIALLACSLLVFTPVVLTAGEHGGKEHGGEEHGGEAVEGSHGKEGQAAVLLEAAAALESSNPGLAAKLRAMAE